MKRILLTSLLLIFSPLLGLAETGEVDTHPEFILTGNESDLRSIHRSFPLLKYQSLFAENERTILIRSGKKNLAASLLTRGSPDTLDALKKHIRINKLKIKLEENSKVFAQSLTPRVKSNSPQDMLYGDQWALKNTGREQKEFLDYFTSRTIYAVQGEDVNLPESSHQGAGMVVAVLDTGVDLDHPDLSSQILTQPKECEALAQYQACLKKSPRRECDKVWATFDSDGNGYPMDCKGWNMIGAPDPITKIYGNRDVKDTISHGTHVSGIIAGAINTKGIQGIAPLAKILPVQVISDNPSGESGTISDDNRAATLTATVARGLLYAISSKVNVINMSLGWNGRADSPLVREMVKLASEKNILVVAAAGNDGTDALVFPCQYSEVICVGAHAADGQMPRFSNYGSGVDIAAPGLNILSSIPNKIDPEVFTDLRGFDFKDGTSMAAPYVAGALAVLMSHGISPAEAHARLLAGARPRPFVESRMVLSGNLDVTRALDTHPRPMITPVEKGVIPTIWDQTQNKIKASVQLKNIWADAKNVNLSLRASDRDAKLSSFKIINSQFNISSWKSSTIQTLSFDIEVLDPKISSELYLILEVKPENGITQTIRIPLQVSVVIWPDKKFPGATYIPFASGTLNPNGRILKIISSDGNPKQDYLVFEKLKEVWKYQILRETDQGYVAGEIKEFPALQGDPRILTRLDVNLDGKSDYVFTHYVEPPRNTSTASKPKVRMPYFHFQFLDENLNSVFESYTFKNETSVLQLEKFQWLKMNGRLVPAWVDVGLTPDAEKSTKYDPWNPNPTDPMSPRLYYHDPSTSDGLRSFATPDGKQVVGILQAGLFERKQGLITVLFSDVNAFVTDFYTAHINEDRPLSHHSLVKVKMDSFRNLRSVEQIKVQPLDPNATWGSNAYVGLSGTHSQRVTALLPGPLTYSTWDQVIAPTEVGDSIYKVMGTYIGSDPQGLPYMASFAQSQYQIKYQDTRSDRVLETSLRRYTFLASALFERSFYPSIAETQGQRVAAIQIPDGFGAYPGAEVIAPVLNSQGQVLELIRPAKLRIQVADRSCDWLRQMDASPDSPSQAVYLCQNQFIRIPYRY